VKLVTNVGYYCSSTATEDVTSALAVFSSFCALAGGASGPATAATAGPGAVTCKLPFCQSTLVFLLFTMLISWC